MSLYIKGIGMIVGMIFGAGIFALPFSFAKAGLFWGIVHFVVVFLMLIFLQLLYAETAYYTKGKHRLTGYVDIFLGKRAKQVAFIATIASYYGTLLVYGLLGGLFLSNFFEGSSAFVFSLLFFAVAAIISFSNLEKIAEINFYLTVPLFGFVIYLLFVSLPSIEPVNFLDSIKTTLGGDWFLPYGVWLFSLAGFATIPETRDIFSSASFKSFKRVILISVSLSALFYFLFIFSVWGVSGVNTTQDALSGMISILGAKALLIGSLIGFLAVFTSFLALSVDMKNIFKYDYNISKGKAWFLTVLPPLVLFLFGASDFVKILGIIGAVGVGFIGTFIIFMSRSLRKKIKEDGSDKILKPMNGDYVKSNRVIETVVLVGIMAGVIYELWHLFI